MSTLTAHEHKLGKVFCSDYEFRIPDYQRQYRWEVEHAVQLLDDLVDAAERGDDNYFLGSIVLVKDPAGSHSDVIDGQQRLTTLTILFSALREATDNPDHARVMEGLVLEGGNSLAGVLPKPRLQLGSRARAFFADHVQQPSAIGDIDKKFVASLADDAHRNIAANAFALFERVRAMAEADRVALMTLLITKTYLVVVSTSDAEGAFRIFGVLNDRGLDLSPSDILKSRVIGAISGEQSAVYTEKWESAEQDLGRESFSTLFLHLRTIIIKERARDRLLKEFESTILPRYLPRNAENFVDEVLNPYADAYIEMRDSSYSAVSGADEVNEWLTRLRRLAANDWQPVVLWALRNHHDDPGWLAAFLSRVERLAASMMIRRVYTTPRATRYFELLQELDNGADLAARSLQLTEAEIAETRSRLDGDIYTLSEVPRYVLLRLDEILAKGSGVSYHHPLISIEHVLPQNPKNGSKWRELFNDDERRKYVHRLGNLVLLNRRKNSELGNREFDVKKTKYFMSSNGNSAFTLTSQVVASDEWTPATLEARQKQLLGLLAAEWVLGNP